MKKILIAIGIFFLSILSVSQNKPNDSVFNSLNKTDLTKKIIVEDLSTSDKEYSAFKNNKISSHLLEILTFVRKNEIKKNDIQTYRINERIENSIVQMDEIGNLSCKIDFIRDGSLSKSDLSEELNKLSSMGVRVEKIDTTVITNTTECAIPYDLLLNVADMKSIEFIFNNTKSFKDLNLSQLNKISSRSFSYNRQSENTNYLQLQKNEIISIDKEIIGSLPKNYQKLIGDILSLLFTLYSNKIAPIDFTSDILKNFSNLNIVIDNNGNMNAKLLIRKDNYEQTLTALTNEGVAIQSADGDIKNSVLIVQSDFIFIFAKVPISALEKIIEINGVMSIWKQERGSRN